MTLEELAKVALDAEQDKANPAVNHLMKLAGSKADIPRATWETLPDAVKPMYLSVALAVARRVLEEAAKHLETMNEREPAKVDAYADEHAACTLKGLAAVEIRSLLQSLSA